MRPLRTTGKGVSSPHNRQGSVCPRRPRLVSLVSNEIVQRLMERVKQLRESLGLTQEAFAERAGLKYKHYQAVEAGRKPNIQFETVLKMARACEVEPWQLLCFEKSALVLAEKQAPYDAGAKRTKPTPASKPVSKRRRS